MFWHGWRAAIWYAEMQLYPIQRPGSGIEVTPYRHLHARAMHDYHAHGHSDMHRQLFPPPPPNWDEIFKDMKRTK